MTAVSSGGARGPPKGRGTRGRGKKGREVGSWGQMQPHGQAETGHMGILGDTWEVLHGVKGMHAPLEPVLGCEGPGGSEKWVRLAGLGGQVKGLFVFSSRMRAPSQQVCGVIGDEQVERETWMTQGQEGRPRGSVGGPQSQGLCGCWSGGSLFCGPLDAPRPGLSPAVDSFHGPASRLLQRAGRRSWASALPRRVQAAPTYDTCRGRQPGMLC